MHSCHVTRQFVFIVIRNPKSTPPPSPHLEPEAPFDHRVTLASSYVI